MGWIGPVQWKSVDGMYEGVGDRGEAPDGLRASGTHWYAPSWCCSVLTGKGCHQVDEYGGFLWVQFSNLESNTHK